MMHPIDFKAINAAALRVARSLLPTLLPGGKFQGDEYVALNPTRNDQRLGSFKINSRTGKWGDFAEEDESSSGGDLISLVAYLRGCSQVEAARELASMVGISVPKLSGAPTGGEKKKCSTGLWNLVTSVPTDAPTPPAAHPNLGQPSERWTYKDATGGVIGYVLRFDSAEEKQFRPLTLWRDTDSGNLEWRWQSWPVKRPLYGLQELADRPSAKVLVCEGEKATDAARSLLPDYVVVTSPNGSESADKADWCPLRGRDVTIWPDADDAGHEYAEAVSKCAFDVGVKSVAVVSLPSDVDDGWDAADALRDGWTPDRAAELIADAARVTERSDAPDSPVTAIDKVNEEIRRLASLSVVEYELERTKAAESLGMRTSVLDEAVKSARPSHEDKKGQGRPFELLAIEPWPTEVDGAELLNEVSKAIRRYIVASSNSVDTLALWAFHTHCFDSFSHTPRAAITSPEKNCGKTTTLDVLGCLVARPLPTANATVSAIFRVVEKAQPTLLIDEADTFLKENDELRGILNSGHRRGGQVMRTVGEDHEPRQFSTFSPAAIAMIGQLPDTLYDRSVVISLRRRKPTETVQSFRSDRAEDLLILARKMARWAQDHQIRIANSDPDMGELANRFADNWRPLFAIADEVGGDWPARVRKIANDADAARIEQSVNVLLLTDIRSIFDEREADRVSSAELVACLTSLDGRPWGEWRNGKAITQNGLARLLGKFQILSGTIRLDGGQTAKGYKRVDFEDVFSRYLPSPSVTPSQLNNDADCDVSANVTPDLPVTVPETSQCNNHGDCDAVTVSNPTSCRMGSIDL